MGGQVMPGSHSKRRELALLKEGFEVSSLTPQDFY
jgi:hypothetical protein